MNRLIEKPHIAFLGFIPLLFLIVLINRNNTHSFSIHDTYYVFSSLTLAILNSFAFGCIGIMYWLMLKNNKDLSKKLNWLHLITTLNGTILIVILSQFYKEITTEHLLSYSDFNTSLNIIIFIIVLLIVVAQLLFIINVISSLIIKNK